MPCNKSEIKQEKTIIGATGISSIQRRVIIYIKPRAQGQITKANNAKKAAKPYSTKTPRKILWGPTK